MILNLFSNLKCILCGSENLYKWQRELIENVLHCRVFSWYGHSEKAVLAGECEKSNFYHIFPEYGIVEFIDKNDNPAKENELAEIVATGFINPAFPLIRYKTKDLGTFSTSKCACGRNYPFIKHVEGRLQEFIVSSKGRYISMVAINMHSDVFDNVKQFQFYQEKAGEVYFNIIKKPTFSQIDNWKIEKELSKKLGDDVSLKIRFVDKIPRTPSGKHRFLIQKLNLKFGD
jgi:Coenzyme F390 synthetase